MFQIEETKKMYDNRDRGIPFNIQHPNAGWGDASQDMGGAEGDTEDESPEDGSGTGPKTGGGKKTPKKTTDKGK